MTVKNLDDLILMAHREVTRLEQAVIDYLRHRSIGDSEDAKRNLQMLTEYISTTAIMRARHGLRTPTIED